MHFGRCNNRFDYYISNHMIIELTCEKILGIFVDNKLHFTEHIYECVKKASKMNNLILANLYQCISGITTY